MIMSKPHTRRVSLTTKIMAAVVLAAAVAITPIITAGPDESEYSGEPITLSIKDADLNDVLSTFAKISGFEILVEPGITGKVTMSVDQVPWDGALVSIVQDQGLEWERDGDQIIIRRPWGEKLVPAKPVKASPPPPPRVEVSNSTVHKYVEGGGIEPPKALEKLPPKYPPEMRKAGISGPVIAELVIDQTGVVRDVAIKESPADEFSKAATETLEQWTFEPATKDGKPVAVSYIVTLMFRLQ